MFLLPALWIMLKLQKHEYNFLGLLGATVLATALDMIPGFLGAALAIVALSLCLMKVTQRGYSDVTFTLGISYAITFAMNIFLLTSLMGDLRSSAHTGAALRRDGSNYQERSKLTSQPADAAKTIQTTGPEFACCPGAFPQNRARFANHL